jgi:molybdopterin-biosynthesis enzyme MoeA-like protein
MTLEGIARGLKRELKLDEHAYNMIKKSYDKAHKVGLLKLEGMTKEREKITPLLKEKAGKFIEKGFLFEGIGESQIAPYVTELESKYPQLWIKTHPRIGLSIEVEISITSFNVENGEELTDRALNEIREIILKLSGKIKERKQQF